MEIETSVELDARLAWSLNIGWTIPAQGATRGEYVKLEARIEELRNLASSGGVVTTTRSEIAGALAQLAEVNPPRRPETIELLSQLVLDIHDSGVLGGPQGFIIGQLHDFGWPVDPGARLVDNVIAAADLGLFDPPARNEDPAPPAAGVDDGPADARVVMATLKVDFGEETAFERAARWRAVQPPPDEPRSAHDQFLFDWEFLLGSIVDILIGDLYQSGHLDIGPG